MKSAARTLEVLEALASGPRRQTLGELCRRLDVPKSSLHALLRTMQDRGWIETDATGTRFGLGMRALLVGTAYVDGDDVVTVASDALDWLVGELDETVHLGRLDGHDVTYLAKRESTHQLRLFSAVGRRLPAYATALGKALLAELPDDRVEEHLPATLEPLTGRTITDLDRLRDELARTRERGYALDDQENTDGIACLAVALPLSDPPTDAISCSVPTVRLGTEQRRIVLDRLRTARDRVMARVPPSRPRRAD